MFERNESALDRAIRLGLGALLLGLALRPYRAHRRPLLAGVLGLVGAVLLFTGATGSCGLYRALGVSTYRPGGA